MARKRPDTTSTKAPLSKGDDDYYASILRKVDDTTKKWEEQKKKKDGIHACILRALDDAAKATDRKPANGGVPAVRMPHFDVALNVLIQARASGVSPSLSPEDESLAKAVWRIAHTMLACAVELDAGGGDQPYWTVRFELEVCTVRELARDIVDKVDDAPMIKRAHAMTTDELTVLLKSNLHRLFLWTKTHDKKLPRDKKIENFKHGLIFVGQAMWCGDVSDEDIEKICAGPLADLLDKRTMPSRAAADAALILLRREHKVSPDAVREGAAKRIRVARRIK